MVFRRNSGIAALLALVAAASMWFYIRRIDVPHQEHEAVKLERPRGNLSDLYPRWLGARELLLHGRDPYSLEVTREIQRGYYGREIDSSRPGDPKDMEGFAYPVYVAFVLAPTLHMDFATVRVLSLWLLTGFTVLSVLLWERVIGLGFSPWAFVVVTLLTLGSYPFAEAISLQQLSLLVAVLLAGSFLTRLSGQLFLSGALLALATIKPQLALLPLLLMVFWVLGNWRERRNWMWGFASTMALLLGASEYLLPGWIFRFYDAARSYQAYIGGTAFLDLLLGARWGGVGRILIALVVLWVGWKARKFAPNDSASLRAMSLALAAAVCTAPNRATYNQVLLLPGLFLAFDLAQRSGPMVRRLGMMVEGLLVWPWIACGILIVAGVVFHATDFVQRAWQLPLYTTLSLPVALLVLLLVLPVQGRIAERS